MANVSPVVDLRKHPRHKVLKDGKIVSMTLQSAVDVTIHDMSASGARVHMPASAYFPEQFGLLVVAEKLLYPAVVRWRKGEMFGLEFEGEPHHVTLRKWNSAAIPSAEPRRSLAAREMHVGKSGPSHIGIQLGPLLRSVMRDTDHGLQPIP